MGPDEPVGSTRSNHRSRNMIIWGGLALVLVAGVILAGVIPTGDRAGTTTSDPSPTASPSASATVVVGTVIDPEMSGEMRVTIVATGLGHISREELTRSVKIVHQETAGSRLDYKDLERPTVMRNNRVGGANAAVAVSQDPDYLDIPAFLRRQAD